MGKLTLCYTPPGADPEEGGEMATTTKTMYRVIARTTGSLQPSGTCWSKTVLYCGYDRLEAARAYHESTPADYWYGYGNRARETVGQRKEIGE